MRRLRWLLVPVVVAGIMTCSDAEAPAGPGWLEVRLSSPNGDDGGIMLVVRGGPIDSVRSPFANAFARRLSASEWRVIVAGNVTSAVVARVWVPDLDAAAQYAATVEQVASGTTYAQRATAGYALTVARP